MSTIDTEKQITSLSLSFDEACLIRDALHNYKQQLKQSPSERGQELYRLAASLADELSDKIRLS
jgi:hypothetical protein